MCWTPCWSILRCTITCMVVLISLLIEQDFTHCSISAADLLPNNYQWSGGWHAGLGGLSKASVNPGPIDLQGGAAGSLEGPCMPCPAQQRPGGPELGVAPRLNYPRPAPGGQQEIDATQYKKMAMSTLFELLLFILMNCCELKLSYNYTCVIATSKILFVQVQLMRWMSL